MRRTIQQTFLVINLASQQKTAKLYFNFFSGKEKIQASIWFHLSHCFCLRSDKLVNCRVWNLCTDLFLNFLWFDPSIKSYFLMVSSLIFSRSLRVYIVKQLFFSISVNSGFRRFGNVYLAVSFHPRSPRLLRIIVKYMIHEKKVKNKCHKNIKTI